MAKSSERTVMCGPQSAHHIEGKNETDEVRDEIGQCLQPGRVGVGAGSGTLISMTSKVMEIANTASEKNVRRSTC